VEVENIVRMDTLTTRVMREVGTFHSDGATLLVTKVTLDGEDPVTEGDRLELEAPDTEAMDEVDREERPLVDPTRPMASW